MSVLDRAIGLIIDRLAAGGTLYACGNGGSDAHAGHLVAELVGRFAYDRPPLRAVHLSSGGPVGSCIANDYGWEQVFARQVEALCECWRVDDRAPRGRSGGDVLVAFTTSGRSRNIIEAAAAALENGASVVFICGPNAVDRAGRDLTVPCSATIHTIHAMATTTFAIQEEHQAWVHEIARRVEEALCPKR